MPCLLQVWYTVASIYFNEISMKRIFWKSDIERVIRAVCRLLSAVSLCVFIKLPLRCRVMVERDERQLRRHCNVVLNSGSRASVYVAMTWSHHDRWSWTSKTYMYVTFTVAKNMSESVIHQSNRSTIIVLQTGIQKVQLISLKTKNDGKTIFHEKSKNPTILISCCRGFEMFDAHKHNV